MNIKRIAANRIFLGLCLLLFVFGLFVATPGSLTAQESLSINPTSGCGAEAGGLPYTALYAAEPGSYSVYARLGMADQEGEAYVYTQGLESNKCTKIGQAVVRGDVWQKIGTWQSSGFGEGTNFLFFSPAVQGMPVANRPTIMLVPDASPVCVPAAECEVTINGETGVIRASGTLLNEDTLHLLEVKDPSKDTIKQVNYYVDDQPVYTKPTLEPFNLRYVGSGNHNLTRVVEYESRQQVVFIEEVERDFANVISHTFFSFIYGQRTVLQVVCLFALLAINALLVVTLVKKRREKQLWEEHHVAHENLPNFPTPTPPPATTALKKFTERYAWAGAIAKNATTVLLLISLTLGLILVTDSYGFQLYQTDGESMRTTLETGDRILINKLPKTWSKLNGRQYVPKRGEVIVAKKRQSALLGSSSFSIGEQAWVKRVIGLPGERVVIQEGVIKVQKPGESGFLNPDQGAAWEAQLQQPIAEVVDVTLAADEIFIVGDNRPGSIDSRSFGPVKIDDIIGRATVDLTPTLKPKRL